MVDGGSLSIFELMTIIGSVAGGTATIVVFVFNGANKIRNEFYRGFNRVTQWQQTHDRKDDRRFAIIDQSIFEISFRNSVRDRTQPPRHKPINQIIEDEGLNGPSHDQEID